MSLIEKAIKSGQELIYIDRSGLASCALIASRSLSEGRTTILVAQNNEELAIIASLVRTFIPSLSSADYPVTQTVWERPLITLPSTSRLFARDAWTGRLAALYALSLNKPCCVVATMQSLILRYVPSDFFDKHTLDISLGSDLSPDLILDQTIEWGYERVSMVTAPGEIARRGDILDIFPGGYAKPVRIEFFGDMIEEMRVFDAESQRSLQNTKEITIIPVSPVPLDETGRQKALKYFNDLRKTGKLNENQAYGLKKSLEENGNAILPGSIFKESSFFEAWLPENPLWILPGEADSAEALGSERLALKDVLEDVENDLQQPAALCLRRKSQPAPWNGKQRIFRESLRIGIEEKGINLPETDYHTFSELFPVPEDKDRPWQALIHALKKWRQELFQILFTFPTERSRKKFLKLAAQDGINPLEKFDPAGSGMYALVSPFAKGSRLEWANILVLGEDIIYPRVEKQRRSTRAFKGLGNFDSLKNGDLLVHKDYGIGKFGGLHHIEINNAANDFLLLEYAGNDKLYIPVDRLSLIQKFKGQEGLIPSVDRLGTQNWINGRERVKKAIEQIAQDLVEMYAYRKVAKSFHYDPPGEIYHEFEATFNFEETPDQARTIQEVLADMEKNEPMDRLVCGDVGFGKTEVAIRAAFRAASEGRQVALLCPTTVLAEQHYQTFRSRLAGFPVNIGLLSRFVPRSRQKEIINACSQGQIDILIGTHRILSNDIKLPNLALLILDEEQRFGVRHKEKLKSLKKNVDVLTLTATPIPRTLQLSMSGIRDLSVIETAPLDRKPVISALLQRDDDTLREVVKREIARNGQVFWVYNRVHDLERVAGYVKNLVPDARVGMAHGQMSETVLEETMRKFWHGELDVLVSTSIVESGLDFPKANTLIVDQAQMFGLGQLYQLRGRVGRSDRQAYAYFVIPDVRKLTDIAAERLKIILDMDYLGAGFHVAMEDLRLRGAGNILGEAQSGHITRVGLDLYLEMLEEAVGKIRGLPQKEYIETELNLGISAHIPENYIADGRERLRYYKALSSSREPGEREEIIQAMRDRFGHFPEELENFLAVLDFKSFIGELQVEKADIHKNSVKLVWSQNQTGINVVGIVKLVSENPEIKLLPPAILSIPIPEKMGLSEGLKKVRSLLEPLRNMEIEA